MAVSAPLQIASVSTATSVNSGLRRSVRAAYRRSCTKGVMRRSVSRLAVAAFVPVGCRGATRCSCAVSGSTRIAVRPPSGTLSPARGTVRLYAATRKALLRRAASGIPAALLGLLAVDVVAVGARVGQRVGRVEHLVHVFRLSGFVRRHARVAKTLHEALPIRVLHGHRLAVRARPSRN